MYNKSLQICPHCGKIMAYNSWFNNYYCTNCGHMPDTTSKPLTKNSDYAILENNNYCVTITIDETNQLDIYDAIINPNNQKLDETHRLVSIHIKQTTAEKRIALIGSIYTPCANCAILEEERLTVLQNNTVMQICITDNALLRHIQLDTDGCNFGIYKTKVGYAIHGEVEITMLNPDLTERWSFSGKDIFVTTTSMPAFELYLDRIRLRDFDDNYYELDFNGAILCSRKERIEST